MADIRITQLPLAAGPTSPVSTDFVAIDNGTTRKASLSGVADAIRPIASQAEAEAGANSVKGMSPLTTKQSIASEIGSTIASASQGALASTALQPSSIGVSVQGYSANLAAFSGTVSQARSYLKISKTLVDDFAAAGDGVTNDDTAVANAISYGGIVDGNGLTYLVTALPSNFLNFRNAAFLNDGKLFRTDDYLSIKKYQVTKTLTYTDWAQDKACQHDGGWIIPFQLAHGHTFDTTRIAWSRSYDKGNTYQAPEVILDVHPESPLKGWNCFAAGVVGNRFVMFAEERDVATEAMLRCIMRDIILDKTYYMTNGIQLTAGSPLAVITVPNHGLVAGDRLATSGITGTDVGGLGGFKTVDSVVDKDRFRINKGSNSATNQANTGGNWIMGHTFYDNAFRETVISNSILQNGSGLMPTHIHSLAVKDAGNGEFFVGFHNGSSSPREVGVIRVQNLIVGTPTFTKLRIPSTYESDAAEPALGYVGTRLYLATRGQNPATNGSSFGYSDDDGANWTFARLPGTIHYTPLPFEIINGTLYLFGSERGENEWNQGSPDNRNNKNRPRSFMLRVPLAEAVAGNFANMTTTLLGYEIYEGEQVSSGVGVGSALYDADEGKLMYFLSSEDYRSSTRYSLNLPSVDNEFLAWGYQPDIYAYEIQISKPRAGQQFFELRGPDMQSNPVYRQGNSRISEAPITFKRDVSIAGTLDTSLKEKESATLVPAAATLVLPAGANLYKITPDAGGVINVTAFTRNNSKNGEIITLTTSAAGNNVIINDTGFLRLGANRSLSSPAKTLTLIRIDPYWHELSWADN